MSEASTHRKYDSFVLYRMESTGTYHRKAGCANKNSKHKTVTHPQLDGGEDIFKGLEVCRFGEESPTLEELCGVCCKELIRVVGTRE